MSCTNTNTHTENIPTFHTIPKQQTAHASANSSSSIIVLHKMYNQLEYVNCSNWTDTLHSHPRYKTAKNVRAQNSRQSRVRYISTCNSNIHHHHHHHRRRPHSIAQHRQHLRRPTSFAAFALNRQRSGPVICTIIRFRCRRRSSSSIAAEHNNAITHVIVITKSIDVRFCTIPPQALPLRERLRQQARTVVLFAMQANN